ncbi:MAG: hypothetical protein HY834_20460 [Devosia nanyangense]|uniref:DUF4062 domain-containing protein n=1 Tax=Devosia nanyangense TaxID=1228055 RepID=A0A933L852_9HYPH|nr:hypothetical protein [Devosia nanyangense]
MVASLKPLFLSSCFQDPLGEKLGIRARVQKVTGGDRDAAGSSRPVWMAEDFPELDPTSPLPGIEKAQLCLDGVRAAECFVAVLSHRHGWPVEVDGAGTVPSSFFEAELFEAALLEKPAFIFLLDGFDPIDRLSNLLKLLGPFFPGMDLTPLSEDEILRRISHLIARYERPRWMRLPLAAPRVVPLAKTLIDLRHRPYDVRSGLPPLRFVGRSGDASLPIPDPAVVAAVIEKARASPKNQTRLMLLWFAIRALMRAPIADPAFAHLLPLWSDAFGAWASAGAWYGLHAHIGMGCIAALGSAAEVRALQGSGPEAWRTLPHGPLATEYYSLARITRSPPGILDLALQHVNAAIEAGAGVPSHAMAIRASIYREMGNMAAALAEYERVCDLRRGEGAGFGEAQNEYGFALVLAGRTREGLRLMEEGIAKETRPDFRIRATRKLALGHARSGHLIRALDLAVMAHDTAVEVGAYDQIRGLERMAKQIDRLRFWRL